MVITELKQTCPRCKGRGHQPGFVAMGISQINYDGRCPSCAGRGFQLTELGQDLLNLLRPFIEEIAQGDKPQSAMPQSAKPAAAKPPSAKPPSAKPAAGKPQPAGAPPKEGSA